MSANQKTSSHRTITIKVRKPSKFYRPFTSFHLSYRLSGWPEKFTNKLLFLATTPDIMWSRYVRESPCNMNA